MLRSSFLIAVVVAVPSAALAKDFTVTDQDQQTIQAICDMAATTPTVATREMRANIAMWCVEWQHRMAEANKPPVATDNKDEKK